MATRRVQDALKEKADMPSDAIPLYAGPPAALLWVLLGGLAPEDAYEKYGFCWHEKSRRVLIPVEGGLVGRAVHGERPKYMMFGDVDFLSLPEGRQGVRVVVEDILSAIAVNRAGWPAIAVLGTGISPTVANAIAAPVVVGWFDPDEAGNKAWVRLRKRMALYPGKLVRAVSDADPKKIHRADIVRILESVV